VDQEDGDLHHTSCRNGDVLVSVIPGTLSVDATATEGRGIRYNCNVM